MSHFTTERVLWDIANNPQSNQQYVSDPDAVLGRYALTEEEKALIKAKDVKALAEQGNSHYLLMAFWVATSGGFAALPDYLGRLNAP